MRIAPSGPSLDLPHHTTHAKLLDAPQIVPQISADATPAVHGAVQTHCEKGRANISCGRRQQSSAGHGPFLPGHDERKRFPRRHAGWLAGVPDTVRRCSAAGPQVMSAPGMMLRDTPDESVATSCA